jgi:hypothetical protein
MPNAIQTEAETIAAYNRSLKGRMAPGGDLYSRPLTRAEMTAPLAWHEKHMAISKRFGVLADGTIGFEVVYCAPAFAGKAVA